MPGDGAALYHKPALCLRASPASNRDNNSLLASPSSKSSASKQPASDGTTHRDCRKLTPYRERQREPHWESRSLLERKQFPTAGTPLTTRLSEGFSPPSFIPHTRSPNRRSHHSPGTPQTDAAPHCPQAPHAARPTRPVKTDPG